MIQKELSICRQSLWVHADTPTAVCFHINDNCVYLRVCICLPVYLCVCLSVCLCVWVCVGVSVCLLVSFYIHYTNQFRPKLDGVAMRLPKAVVMLYPVGATPGQTPHHVAHIFSAAVEEKYS